MVQEEDLKFIKKYKNLVGRPYLTRFLDLNEQALLASMDNVSFFGGYKEAERKVAASELEINNISLIKITYNSKFGKLTHRDCLGSFFSLGLDLSVIGDIALYEDEIYLFVISDYVPYLLDNFTKIKNLNVTLKEVPLSAFKYEDKGISKKCFVKSFRLDLLISEAFNLARDEAKQMVLKELIRVNQKLITSPSLPLKLNDIVSVRGKGRFKLVEIGNVSKSGNTFVILKLYK